MSFRGRMEIRPGQTVLWTDGQKFLGKNPWQQSHDLKIVLVGFSFHFSFSSSPSRVCYCSKIIGNSDRSVEESKRSFFVPFQSLLR